MGISRVCKPHPTLGIHNCGTCGRPVEFIEDIGCPNQGGFLIKSFLKQQYAEETHNYGEKPMTDNVKQPGHYMLMDGELETIDLIKDRTSVMDSMMPQVDYNAHAGYCYGNAIKYLMRWPMKNGVEDLRKCREYIDMLIGELT